MGLSAVAAHGAWMKLFLFDVDGTLIRGTRGAGGLPGVPYDTVDPLPGRRERLQGLHDLGHKLGMVTNQGGVAMGYQTEGQVIGKMLEVRNRLFPRDCNVYFEVCYTHPKAKIDHYLSFCAGCGGVLGPRIATLETCEKCGGTGDAFRKPSPGMLLHAMDKADVSPDQTTFVGDMESDRQAAAAAGIAYWDAEEFFNVDRLLEDFRVT